MFEAICFTVLVCGFVPRCALERIGSDEIRLRKILQIIGDCDYGIHDICRGVFGEPRLNMPFELGVYVGCREFGGRGRKRKKLLILDNDPFRYRQALSDIAGQDVHAHGGQVESAILHVRNWLSSFCEKPQPSAGWIWDRCQWFRARLPEICAECNFVRAELTFIDYVYCVKYWLEFEVSRVESSANAII